MRPRSPPQLMEQAAGLSKPNDRKWKVRAPGTPRPSRRQLLGGRAPCASATHPQLHWACGTRLLNDCLHFLTHLLTRFCSFCLDPDSPQRCLARHPQAAAGAHVSAAPGSRSRASQQQSPPAPLVDPACQPGCPAARLPIQTVKRAACVPQHASLPPAAARPTRYGCLEAVPPADAPTLFSAATRYGLPALRAGCLRVLCGTTTVETVSTHVLLAYEHQCSELMQVGA